MMAVRTAVTYTLSRCVKCMRCVQACPTSALTMHDNRISVNDERCINCAQCIRVCHSRGLLAKGSTLSEISQYDYTVCMVPGAMLSRCSSEKEAAEFLNAVKLLGFDEVVDLTDIEGQVLLETDQLAKETKDTVIASSCPVVNNLIRLRYPMLTDNLAPFDYPSEIAARVIRRRLRNHRSVGIFNFCECEAKLLLAKNPYGHDECETDHALSIVDILPMIRANMKKGNQPVALCQEGLMACDPMMIQPTQEDLTADGYAKINDILNMAEFDLLKSFRLLRLYSCFGGCIGGHLLWGNTYLSKSSYLHLTSTNHRPPSNLSHDDLIRKSSNAETETEQQSLSDKLVFFKKVNDQLEKLPGYDCSACGMQTCRIMAEEIVKGKKTLDDCHILHSIKEQTK